MKTLFVVLVVELIILVDSRRGHKWDYLDVDYSEEENGESWASKDKAKNKHEKEKKVEDYDGSDLCRALKCGRHQVCLVENERTAFCISKKKLRDGHKIFQEFILNQEKKMLEKQCVPCEDAKRDFICGSDGVIYSSVCRLDYENCRNKKNVTISCPGLCPCPESKLHTFDDIGEDVDRLQSLFDKLYGVGKINLVQDADHMKEQRKNVYHNKLKQTRKKDGIHKKHHVPTVSTTTTTTTTTTKAPPTKHSNKKTKVNHKKQNSVFQKNKQKNLEKFPKTCTKEDLKIMGERLLDWFDVLLNDDNHLLKKHPDSSPIDHCRKEVSWMFHHLDQNNDRLLSLKELYDLEHDEQEHCIKPFLDKCDFDLDIFLGPHEWCTCFSKIDPPCRSMKRKVNKLKLGADVLNFYVPECDGEGYFRPLQCRGSECWCVDKHGIEYANTRKKGHINCHAAITEVETSMKYSLEELDTDYESDKEDYDSLYYNDKDDSADEDDDDEDDELSD